jgi:photosystem II stability/assembly factor-like uncharacterized protein
MRIWTQSLLIASCFVSLLLVLKPAAPKPIPQAKPPRTSGAGLAMDAWWAMRAYPDDHINMQAYAEAAQAHIQGVSTAKTTSANWESIGPHNIGGRTLRIAFNPQDPTTIYAGSAAGGLWRSYSGGAGVDAWQRIPTGFPILGVGAIAVSPVDSNLILIGTGEVYNDKKTGNRLNIRTTRGSYGIGILMSNDHGQTWFKTLDWSYGDLRGVQDIAFDPANPNVAIAATSEGTYRSADAGLTWTQVHAVRMANDIVYHPSIAGTLIVACGNMASASRGLYRSTDGGLTFSLVGSGLPTFTGKITLSSTQDAPYWLYASVADSLAGKGLWRSTDWGTTWTMAIGTDFQTYQGWYSHDVSVNPFNRNKIMVGGIDAWRTEDAAASLTHASDWTAWYLNATPPIGGPEGFPTLVHADIHEVIHHPTDSNQIYFATDGGIFRSRDGGYTFEGCNGRYQTSQFYAEFSNSRQDSNLAIGGLQDNATAVYQGDKAWYRVIGGDGCGTQIDPYQDDLVYASTQYCNIFVSYDRGLNFNYLPNQPLQNTAAFATNFVLCEASPSTMYAASDYVSVSGDGGNFWTATNGGNPLNGNNVLRLAVDRNDCGKVFASVAPGAGLNAKLFRTTDGGGSWVDITGILPNRYYHEITINPAGNGEVYVAVGGFGTDHIYKSTDDGNTWAPAGSGLPDVPANTVFVDPAYPSEVYMGNDLGVYYSANGGASWSPFSNDLPEAVIAMSLSLSKSNRKLRLATHGSGVYEISLPVAVDRPDPKVTELSDLRLAPNPARTHTQASFALQKASAVRIRVYNSQGQLVAAPLSGKTFPPGAHSLAVDVADMAVGIYFVNFEAQGFKRTLRLGVIH